RRIPWQSWLLCCAEGRMKSALSASATEEREDQREQDADDNRRRERKIETEAAAAHHDVAGQPSKGHSHHDQQAECRNAEAEINEQATHACSVRLQADSINSIPAKK